MLHQEDERSRRIRERAYTLAEAGHFKGWREIEKALIAEGWPNSRSVLNSEFVRRSIDSRCAAAKHRETRH